MGGDSPDTSAQDATLAMEQEERANKLKSLEQQRFDIIKGEGAPIWNSIAQTPVNPSTENNS